MTFWVLGFQFNSYGTDTFSEILRVIHLLLMVCKNNSLCWIFNIAHSTRQIVTTDTQTDEMQLYIYRFQAVRDGHL